MIHHIADKVVTAGAVPTTTADQRMVDLVGSGWLWVDLGGSGLIWVDLGGSGWIWVDLGGSG